MLRGPTTQEYPSPPDIPRVLQRACKAIHRSLAAHMHGTTERDQSFCNERIARHRSSADVDGNGGRCPPLGCSSNRPAPSVQFTAALSLSSLRLEWNGMGRSEQLLLRSGTHTHITNERDEAGRAGATGGACAAGRLEATTSGR
jgi:hypothetical protein